MAAVYEGRRTLLHPLIRPVEVALYRVGGIDEEHEYDWQRYALILLAFNALGFALLYLILRLQGSLPLNPQGFDGLAPGLAFNTSMSFVTNTSWQSYGGETTLSYFSQMVGIAFQCFVSAAVGMAALVALIRGLTRREAETLGNFWVDLTRSTLYILVPIAFVGAVFFVSQGVIQNFHDYRAVTGLEGAVQTFPGGPAASQVAIKLISNDGGGLFNAQSAHPFENPTAWSNVVQMLYLLLIPVGSVYMFGKMVGSTRHAWVLLTVLFVLFVVGTVVATVAEQHGTDALKSSAIRTAARDEQPGGNMEGKEVRFGIASSALFTNGATASSDGAVNSMLDSYTPIGGMVALANMATGEVIFGGAGSGMYSVVVMVLVTVFVGGLMVGRTPEYLGKKVEPFEMKAVMAVLLVFPLLILAWTGVAATTDWGTSRLGNGGPHGFSEQLYAFMSAAATNGSGFGGLGANVPFYNYGLAICMFVGRFLPIVAVLAIAGSMAKKQRLTPGLGTFATDGVVFGALFLGVILIEGLLVFFPALALGPIAEHLAMGRGTLF